MGLSSGRVRAELESSSDAAATTDDGHEGFHGGQSGGGITRPRWTSTSEALPVAVLLVGFS